MMPIETGSDFSDASAPATVPVHANTSGAGSAPLRSPETIVAGLEVGGNRPDRQGRPSRALCSWLSDTGPAGKPHGRAALVCLHSAYTEDRCGSTFGLSH